MEPFHPQKLPLVEIELESLVGALGKANRALAFYDGILQGIPNPDILLSPLITREAVLSSRIEGTQATLGDVLRFDAGEAPPGESRRQDITEIINYRRALRRAEEVLASKPFHLNLLLELHAILLDSVRGKDRQPGRFRTGQNWIGLPGTPMEQAFFVPPSPLGLREFLDNWERYYHLDRPDLLAQLAVVHAQFEILHPFSDGNGRLGRMLIPLFLHEKSLLSQPTFYLSEYLEEHRDAYVAHLRPLGREEGAWVRWIRFFLEAVAEQAARNTAKARAILALYTRLKDEVITLTHSQYAVPLLDRMFAQPVFQPALFQGQPGMPSKPMVANLLNRLKTSGILKTLREGRGRRPQVLVLAELVNICEGKEVF